MEQFSPNLEHIIENNLNVIERLKSLPTENNIEIPYPQLDVHVK